MSRGNRRDPGGPARNGARTARFARRLNSAIADLPPSYFAMVMASGIVSIAVHMHGMEILAVAIFALNIAVYAILWFLTIVRIIRFRQRFLADLIDHRLGPGFFTSVAGSCVVGSQSVIIAGAYEAAIVLWVLGALLWIVLTYTIFTALSVKHDKPSLAEGINGGWLLAVVATQSIAVLGALIAGQAPQPIRLELNFLALSMWLWGGMLYTWMIALIFYRYTFFRFRPGDLTPPYWINMGAMAISALAGTLLISNAQNGPFLNSLLPFLEGFTILYWATGTWWIPMLLVLGAWRHLFRRFPLRYDPLYWGAVFPLGMYSAATESMSDVMALDFLRIVSRGFLYVALFAWGLTFAGFLYTVARNLSGRPGPGELPPRGSAGGLAHPSAD